MLLSLVSFGSLCQGAALGGIRYIDDDKTIGLENRACRIVFDRATGSLQSLVNLATDDEYLKGGAKGNGMPFRVYRGLTKQFEINDVAASISRDIVRPADCKLIEISQKMTG